MLIIENTVMVVVDVQGKLAELMHGREPLYRAINTMIRAANILGQPILWVEQNPGKMGPTVAEIRGLLLNLKPIAKMAFSCARAPQFMEALRATGRKQILLTGIETHVCIAQTAADLCAQGYETAIIADAVSSRTAENKALGLELARSRGALVTGVESALFEMLGTAEHPSFRQVLQLVK